MSSIHVTDRHVLVEFTTFEKIAGLIRNQTLPVGSIEHASSEAEPLTVTRGWRSPGLALPGRRKIGTWRSRGERHLVCVGRGQSGVLIVIRGHKYDTMLIGDDDAAMTVDRIRAAVRHATNGK